MSVRYALLGLLAQHPRHGYELRSSFEALAGGKQIWDVKPAQVYTTLARLEESGLIQQEAVEQSGGPEKRIYSITPAGRCELGTWFETGVEAEHQRDEFYIKLVLSLALNDVDPYRVIHAQRSRIYQELHLITTRRNHADPDVELGHILLLDKTVMHLEADLRWLEAVESRLDEIRRQPMPAPEARPRGRPRKSTNNQGE